MSSALRVSAEVAEALRDGQAVVALESSVICQGLPPPHNLANAQSCERAIRAEGALPATIALLDGEICVGLSAAELVRLSSERCLLKVGIRDLGFGIARRGTGGTTVSATLSIAATAGIQVFATGGIGGVHRGDASDVSADLPALGRYPVLVVCAGAKSILDVPRTLEMLETLSVPVVGLRTQEFPAFYVRTSGLPLEQSVADEAALARQFEAHRALGLGSALLAVQPCPADSALPADLVETAVADALAEAEQAGIQGKAITPFLLGAVARATSGRALTANLALLESNARAAARVAVALGR